MPAESTNSLPSVQHGTNLDFKHLFESLPGLYLILDETFNIVAVSNAYLKATLTERDHILHKNIFEIFPDDPADPDANGVRNLRASLQRCLQHQVADVMPIQKYSIALPGTAGAVFEERYWSPTNIPIAGRNIIHRVEDVTEFIRLQSRERAQKNEASVLRDHTQRMEAEILNHSREITHVNAALHQATIELEKTVQQRTASLEQANQELRDEIQQKEALQKQMQHAQKMEAIGTLVGGIAHDFNNILTVILTCNSLLMEKPMDAADYELMTQSVMAGERAKSLISQLMTFSRKKITEKTVVNLNDIVRDSIKLMQRLFSEDIQLVTELEENLPPLFADADQILQVLLNLSINARDAMPSGGTLWIRTASRKPADIILTLRDNGCGMDDTTRARIFEPFFTTKGLGRGTGLGLATVFGIVQQYHAAIDVDSVPGRGTTFTLTFTACEAKPTPLKPVDPTLAACTGNETILLIEDDVLVRSVTARVLGKLGYTVLQASSGNEAIAHYQNSYHSIDLVISDIVMADGRGHHFVESMRKQQPDIKVLYISGYTDEDLIAKGILQDSSYFLEKPFTPQLLAKKIYGILNS